MSGHGKLMYLKMGKKFWCPILLVLLSSAASYAQFYTTGDDPASVKWYRTDTETYRIIYPEGLDSLARVYAVTLEKYKAAAGRSAGYVPGEWTVGRIPVILHAFNANSNGSVAWAPKRMDLYTSPQAYGSEPMPWTDMLAIHEQRHVAQMQAGLSGAFRPFGWVLGEMFNGFVAGIYPSTAFLEGDAVVAETALSSSGRGRTGDFLNYYMIAFDNGDFRSWNRWRFGSQRYYAPDHYAAGYFLLSGIRYVYNVPDFSARYFHHIARRPYDFNAFRNVLKKTVGKTVKTAYREIADTMSGIWADEIRAREPFIPYRQIVKAPYRYTEYSRNKALNGLVYAVRSGIVEPASLVKVTPDGKTRRLRAFSSSDGKFSTGPDGRIYWSEAVPDKRWSHRINSVIRYFDTASGKTVSISKQGRLSSPSVSEDGKTLSVTEYLDNGRSAVAIMDADSGDILCRVPVPDSLQAVESIIMRDSLYITAISSSGYGIYARCQTSDGCSAQWTAVLPPQPVKIMNLDRYGSILTFMSDRTGVNEFYHFDPASHILTQKTSTRYGADDFVYSQDGKRLIYSLRQYDGHLLAETDAEDLLDREVEFGDIHRYKVADVLSEQEKGLAAGLYRTDRLRKCRLSGSRRKDTDTVHRYRKAANLFKIHSWAPVYFNVDRLRSFSYDRFYEMLSLGAAGISQNELGTAVTQFGYSAHKDPYNIRKWRHSGHLNFSYTGWYPVIEASVDFNDRAARNSSFAVSSVNGLPESISSVTTSSDNPYINASLSVYVPFNFSRGGWQTGLVPIISYSFSNDRIRTVTTDQEKLFMKSTNGSVTVSQVRSIPVQTLSGSLRFYTMRPVASSGIYPRWGIGFEGGAMSRPALEQYYSPMSYAYIYGYAPGIIPQHGLHFSVTAQSILNQRAFFGSPAVNTLPQGLDTNSELLSVTSMYSDKSMKLSIDYAIPIYIGDITIFGPFMYLKRLTVTPQVDFTMFDWMENYQFRGNLFSAGASLTLDFDRLFWLRFPFSVGITYSWSGGTAFDTLREAVRANGSSFGHHYLGPIFSVDF